MVDADHASLVRSAALGGTAGRAAETEICRRFAPRIRLYGLRHLRNEDRAADLVQLVLLATVEAVRRGAVEQPERLDRFVLGTCRNTTLRIRERDARLEPRSLEELDLASVEPAVEMVDIDALFRCIAALGERPRAVVQLSFTEERAPDEIATALGTTPANVRVLRHRAIAQLRECLDLQPRGSHSHAHGGVA
jgi:RNA polymerase sigma-70 factor (ECF subfamily)